MKRFNLYILTLLSVLAFGWSACTDSLDYEAAPGVNGEGVYFPSSVKTSITLNKTEGSIELNVQRTKTEGAIEAALTASFTEGGASVFSVPAKVSFVDGKAESTVTVNYSNLVRGTTYKVTLAFADGTPYGGSSLTFTILYPAEVIEEWIVVSTEAVLMDNLFSMYGVKDVKMEKLKVEQVKGTNKYRIQSPYNNWYFNELFGEQIFPENFVFPYIILDGDKFKKEAPGSYYIPAANLGFQMVNGEGPKVDMVWNTFGSVAGNLQAGGAPIPPTSAQYPLGSYDAKSKMFDFGTVYHNLGGGAGFQIVPKGSFSLYLDPKLMSPDFDRDFAWSDVTDGAGYFVSEIVGEKWMQGLQQATEDPTFYRFTSLYAEGVHIYFNYDAKKGIITMPKKQPSGFTTFGNKVFIDAVPGGSKVNADTKIFTFALSFYLVDEAGQKTAELAQTEEEFWWGQGPLDQLVKGKKIDDYVGNWDVPAESAKQSGIVTVSITKEDATTLLVNGLSVMNNYDDTMVLNYVAETGYLEFAAQGVAAIQGFQGLVVPFNSAKGELTTAPTEKLIGGLKSDGTLMFLASPTNEGTYDSMVYLVVNGAKYQLMSGFWNYLEWTPVASAASFNTLKGVSFQNGFKNFKTVKKGITPRRTYKTELNMKATPVKHNAISTRIQTPSQNGLTLDVR